MFEKFLAFFTPVRRKAIYGVVGAVAAALLAFNIVTAEQMTTLTDTIIRVMTVAATLMAFFNTSTATQSGMPPVIPPVMDDVDDIENGC